MEQNANIQYMFSLDYKNFTLLQNEKKSVVRKKSVKKDFNMLTLVTTCIPPIQSCLNINFLLQKWVHNFKLI